MLINLYIPLFTSSLKEVEKFKKINRDLICGCNKND
jgi:hypothetical protein